VLEEISLFFNMLSRGQDNGEAAAAVLFLPGGKICRLRAAQRTKESERDCLTGIRPILKSRFSAVFRTANSLSAELHRQLAS
jgi:hypothetical protein